MSLKSILCVTTILGAAAFAGSPVFGQTASPAAAGDVAQRERAATPAGQVGAGSTEATPSVSGSKLDDIVVYGRKRGRAEELQQTPVAITALGAAQIQKSTVRDIVDVGRLTPNASLQPSAQKGVQNFSIRGIGVSGASASDEPAVGIFQDGVYWGSNYGALNELVDVEGIEILRGPQGTLFGRNVTGGAVTVRSARPTMTDYARVTAGVSNGIGVDGSMVVNTPVSDTVAVRLAAMARYNDGLFRITQTRKSYGKSTTELVRPSIKWTPSSDFDITFLGEYYHQDGDPIAVRGISPRTVPGSAVTLAETAGYVTRPDYREIQVGEQGYANLNVYFGMVEANWKVGPGTLTSISGYRKVKSHSLTDPDGFPVLGFQYEIALQQHQWSEELRYAADINKWLSFTAGGYYFTQHFDYAEARDLNNHATLSTTRSTLDNDSYAFFAEADIKPFDKLTLTLGGRYTHETKDAVSAAFGACAFGINATCTYRFPPTYKGSNFSPKVGLSYKIDNTKMLFASWTRGFRSGGYSLRGTPVGSPYGAEKVNAFEAGFKSDLFDRHVRFNITGFYNKFTNLQRNVLGVDPVQGVVNQVFNAANADIKGVELELTLIPVTGLSLSGNYGYTDAKYKSFAGFPNFASLQFVRVPKNTLNLTGDYEMRVGNSGNKIAFHAGGSYTTRYFFDDPNQLSQPAYWLADASVSFTLHEKTTFTIWSRNITDTRYSVWGSTLGALGENRFPGDPVTYGVRVAHTF